MSHREPSSELVSFSGELFRLRVLRGLTQANVANDARLNRGYYSQIENARRAAPPPNTLKRISAALRLTELERQKLFELARTDWLKPYRLDATESAAEQFEFISSALNLPAAKLHRIRAILEEK